MSSKVKAKIICTLGPASSSETVLRKMMRAGMDVGRLNFSHGKPQELLHRIGLIRLLNAKYRRRIKLLGDLQGHRIRIGDLCAPVELKKRQTVWLWLSEAKPLPSGLWLWLSEAKPLPSGLWLTQQGSPSYTLLRKGLTQQKIKGTHEKIPFDYQGPLRTIKNGHQIFIDDGNIALEVISRAKNSLKAKVIIGGLLKEHKGVNIPEARLEFGGISQKDMQDILFCEKNSIEYIAQSFVRTKKDILDVRKVLGGGSRCRVIAKIENREGIKNIDEIIKASDGIMIARGDMGVSLPIHEIPIIQKVIIKKCNRAGKFVITATQMLESMAENLRPTRAEVTDVANAIIDGTDFVMLSAESAVGKYPVETVGMMNNIIKFTEGYLKRPMQKLYTLSFQK